jgi:hypothetical protein
MCKIAPFAATLSVNVSVYTLVLISLDRYRKLFYPFKCKVTIKDSYFILSILWTLSLVLSLVKLINFKTDYIDVKQTVMICGPVDHNLHKIETIALIIIQYIIPFLIISFTYTKIAFRVCLYTSGDAANTIQTSKKYKVKLNQRTIF